MIKGRIGRLGIRLIWSRGVREWYLQANSCSDIGLRSFRTFEPDVVPSSLVGCQSLVFLSICTSTSLYTDCITKSHFKEMNGLYLLMELHCPFPKSCVLIHPWSWSRRKILRGNWYYISREEVQTPDLLLTGNFLPQWKGKEPNNRDPATTPLPSLDILWLVT